MEITNVDFKEIKEPEEVKDPAKEQDDLFSFIEQDTETKPEASSPAPAPTDTEELPEAPTQPPANKAQKFAAKKIARVIEELNAWSFEPWAMSKMRRKIFAICGAKYEWDELLEILDTHDTTRLDEEKINKAKKLFDRWERKIEKIKFTDEERAELENDIQEYQKATGRLELSPEASLMLGIGGLMSKRLGLILLS